jgi:predicted nucleic acid-binding Zn ribbon protein
MQISALIIGLSLLAAAAVYVSRPFWQKRKPTAQESKSNKNAHNQHGAVLTALRDLDFDYKTGKVSEEDYQPLRARLLVEAAKSIETTKRDDEQLEAMIQARRKTAHQGCEHCGTAITEGQKFCSRCGSSIGAQPCPSCGKKLQKGDVFCSSCGTKIEMQVPMAANS